MLRLRGLIPAVCLLGAAAHAGTLVNVYSNFSEDSNAGLGFYPYACSDSQCSNLSAYTVEWHQSVHFGASSTAQYGAEEAMPFTVSGSQNLYLYELQLAMYKWPDGTAFDGYGDTIAINHDNLTVQLVSDAGGLPSGNVLDTLVVNPAVPEDGETFLNLFSSSRTMLQAGQTYWVVALPTTIDMTDPSQDAFFGWMENQEGSQWNYTINQWNPSYNSGLGAFQGFFRQPSELTAPALNVLATTDLSSPVPEPASIALAGLALTCLFVWRNGRTGAVTACQQVLK
jgi:hypothetical protein